MFRSPNRNAPTSRANAADDSWTEFGDTTSVVYRLSKPNQTVLDRVLGPGKFDFKIDAYVIKAEELEVLLNRVRDGG